MRKKKSKQMRRLAEAMTVGDNKAKTRQQYKRLKLIYKETKGEL